jgi:hypothetical protein
MPPSSTRANSAAAAAAADDTDAHHSMPQAQSKLLTVICELLHIRQNSACAYNNAAYTKLKLLASRAKVAALPAPTK